MAHLVLQVQIVVGVAALPAEKEREWEWLVSPWRKWEWLPYLWREMLTAWSGLELKELLMASTGGSC